MKTIRDLLETSCNSFSDYTAVRWLVKKEVHERTYSELGENVTALRKGLKAAGFSGDHIALIGVSSISWIEAYLSVATGDNVAIPLDAALPVEDLISLINDSDSTALFLSPLMKEMAGALKTNCPKLEKIWILSENSEEGFDTLTDLKKSGNDSDAPAPKPEDLITLIYTSGTTGKSKGVMLTQHNLVENINSISYHADPGGVTLSVLPIHHAFCLVMDLLKPLELGTCICLNDSLMHMVRNMGLFKPQIMLMVPLMIETIYKRLSAAEATTSPEVLKEQVFGGRLQVVFVGGAHLDPYYIDKFEKYGILVLEGYGMSECSPVISSNQPECYKKGSVGKPLPNVEIKIENDEVLVKGTSVMRGYYKMDKETGETLKDGWLHTGDKGYIDEDGFLFINGRVKNLIILSNGENVSPEEIENKLALAPLIGEVVVTGENNGLTARIYPDQDVIKFKNIPEETIAPALQGILDEYNSKQPTYRQITGLVIRKHPFIRNTTKKIIRAKAEIDE